MPFFCPRGGPLQDPYALLGLEHGATDDEIAKSFKRLMLRLHPDKQPPDQPPEEAEEISRKFHDVMDAKSFLLDGEHLAARRAYDSKLARAKQEAKLASLIPPQQQQAGIAKSSSAGTAPKPNSNPAPSSKDKHNPDNVFPSKSDGNKAKPASYAKKNNVNVKQWGKPRSKNRPAATRSSTAYRRPHAGDADPMRNKTHARARSRSRAFDDSCGDCSTTDDCSSTSDDERRRQQHTYSSKHVGGNNANNKKPSSNRPSASNKGAGTTRHPNKAIPRRGSTGRDRMDSGNDKRNNDGGARPPEPRRHSDTDAGGDPPPRSGYRPADAARSADYSNFYPAVDTLERQYHCPLTREVMKEPMSDFEGNSYERAAILKYLETNSTSPVTGNPLYAMHLTPNSALKEKIRYTLKLKDCIDSLQKSAQPPPLPTAPEQRQQQQQSTPHSLHREAKYKSLREAVDSFIKDLNSNSPAVTIPPLDNSGATSFSYLGLKFHLEVPNCVDNDNVVIQTWFDHSRKSASILGRVVGFNAALHKNGMEDSKLTYRHMKGKYAFTLTKKMDAEKFSKTLLRHGIEYFVEMSIKLHNIIFSTDVRKVDKVRLTNGAGVAATAAGQ